jgi:hypothetical protein
MRRSTTAERTCTRWICSCPEDCTGPGSRQIFLQGKLVNRRERFGRSVTPLGQNRPFLQCVGNHLNGHSYIGWNNHCGRERTTAHPSLAGLWETIHAGEGQAQPAGALIQIVESLENLACSHRLDIILCRDQVMFAIVSFTQDVTLR